MSVSRTEPWLGEGSEQWFGEAESWIRDVFRARDLGVPGELERVKARPWSVVLRAESERTRAWFKAAGAGGAHEAGLLTWLGERWEAHVPVLLDVHASRPWMLMQDAGTRPPPAAEVASLLEVLPRYAELQIASGARVDDLLALGVPDRRPGRLPDMLRELIAGDSPDARRYAGLFGALRPRVEELLPVLEGACAELTASPRAAALDHGDLHGANLLRGDSGLRLCDWGDASVTHPFCSLRVTLQMAVGDSPDPDRAERARELCAAYLEPWTSHAPRSTLRAELATALWIGRLVRVFDWVHMLAGADEASFAHWSPHVAQDLATWLEPREPEGCPGE